VLETDEGDQAQALTQTTFERYIVRRPGRLCKMLLYVERTQEREDADAVEAYLKDTRLALLLLEE
jgi:hypothetical protein